MFSANSSQVSEDRLYVEDVFSTYLYTGNGSTQTITNGINLSGRGGMVWIKNRTSAYQARIVDTVRGATNGLIPSATNSTVVDDSITAFNSNGFTVGNVLNSNASGEALASWTFRKAPKFFDVVTYTGDGTGDRTISHSLTTSPGMVIIRPTNLSTNWRVWHRYDSTKGLRLNLTDAQSTNDFLPSVSSTGITVDTTFNGSGNTYVAYLFAHDTASDGIIQCGSFTTDGSGNATVNLGWEPQWVMVKGSSNGGAWWMNDAMRGMPATPTLANLLQANSSSAEVQNGGVVNPTSTGFTTSLGNSGFTYIYIAIRRGPMRTPTLGTSVYKPVTQAGGSFVSNGFTTDFMIQGTRPIYGLGTNAAVVDRLRGGRALSIGLGAENGISYHKFDYNTGVEDDYSGGSSDIYWSFRRAPSFFDAVCYTGTGATQTINHNLGVAPELIITKRRNDTSSWLVHHTFGSTNYKEQYLNQNSRQYTDNYGIIFSSAPTATNYTIQNTIQLSGATYVAYLFASCPGVSKIGTYTGNGSSQTINCGFAAGARFVMIKRTDSAGDWFVWDTARGIVSGNDPYMAMNLANPEDVYGAFDTIDPTSSGFIVNEDGLSCNTSSATYIYLAVA